MCTRRVFCAPARPCGDICPLPSPQITGFPEEGRKGESPKCGAPFSCYDEPGRASSDVVGRLCSGVLVQAILPPLALLLCLAKAEKGIRCANLMLLIARTRREDGGAASAKWGGSQVSWQHDAWPSAPLTSLCLRLFLHYYFNPC